MPRPMPFIDEEAGKLITAENNNQKQVRTIEGILFHKHGGGITDEFPNHDDFDNYDDYLAEIAKVGSKVSGDAIEDKTITMDKLHADVKTAIGAGAVEDDEIKSAMIADADGENEQDTTKGLGIKTPHIQDNAVATGKIANGAVTMNKLHADVKTAIGAGAVEDDEIKSAMIADADGENEQDTTKGSGIKTPHIQNNAVTEEKIANDAVTMDKLDEGVKTAISAGEVGVDEIKSKMIDKADGTTGQNTEDGSGIKTLHIQNEAVTMDKLDEDVKTAISAGEVGVDEIKSKMIDKADGTTGQNAEDGSGIKTPHIQDNAVTMDKLDEGVKNAISAAEVGDEAVTTGMIANGAVTPEKLDRSYAQSPISFQELKTQVIEGEVSINPNSTNEVILGNGGHVFYLPSVILKPPHVGRVSWKKVYRRWTFLLPINPIVRPPVTKSQHLLSIENHTNNTVTVSYMIYKISEE